MVNSEDPSDSRGAKDGEGKASGIPTPEFPTEGKAENPTEGNPAPEDPKDGGEKAVGIILHGFNQIVGAASGLGEVNRLCAAD